MKSFHLLALSTLLTPTLCGIVRFNACYSSQETILTAALQDVQLISQQATKQSEGGGGHLHDWFGQGGRISNEKIDTRYHKFSNILRVVPKKDVTFYCAGKLSVCCGAGLGGVPACSDRPGDDHINICPAFWNWHVKQRVYELAVPTQPTNEAVDVKYRGYGYILLHELLHSQNGSLDIQDTVKDEFGKTSTCRGYGHYCVLKYAQKNPDNARGNADTYALFALAAYYGIDKYQTNPDLFNT